MQGGRRQRLSPSGLPSCLGGRYVRRALYSGTGEKLPAHAAHVLLGSVSIASMASWSASCDPPRPKRSGVRLSIMPSSKVPSPLVLFGRGEIEGAPVLRETGGRAVAPRRVLRWWWWWWSAQAEVSGTGSVPPQSVPYINEVCSCQRRRRWGPRLLRTYIIASPKHTYTDNYFGIALGSVLRRSVNSIASTATLHCPPPFSQTESIEHRPPWRRPTRSSPR